MRAFRPPPVADEDEAEAAGVEAAELARDELTGWNLSLFGGGSSLAARVRSAGS